MPEPIIINEQQEELIHYPDKQWKHVILHNVMTDIMFGYIPLHWHHTLQFMYVIKGELIVHISGSKHYLNAGDGIFINSNIIHEIAEQQPYTEYYCWNVELPHISQYVEFEYVDYILQHTQHIPYIVLRQSETKYEDILSFIKNAGQTYDQQSTHYQLTILNYYYNCLKWLYDYMGQHVNQQRYQFDYRIKHLITLMQQNYHHKITLTDLSEHIHMSKAETIKLFKKYVGYTPFSYLLNYRLEKSKEQLLLATYSVTEVAMNCGFATTSYFIKAFKAHYQETPKQFQLRQLNLR